MNISARIESAMERNSESADLEFKREFDGEDAASWPELIKDIIAMSNSGGGVIVCGVNNDGSPSGLSAQAIIDMDPAKIADKIRKYVGFTFDGFHVHRADKFGHTLAVLLIEASEIPMVFVNPGAYRTDGGNQTTAFGKGTVYFRHGAKSETAEQVDLPFAFERLYKARRDNLYSNIQKVIQAPPNSVFVPIQRVSGSNSMAVRITDDPGAQPVSISNPDDTHPYRMKELLKELKNRVPTAGINSRHILQIRKHFDIDSDPRFHTKSKHSAHQYSVAFMDWILSNYEADLDFFKKMHDAQ